MKTRNSAFPRSARVLALACLVGSLAHAADRPAAFVVPANQMQTLGIQTAPLQISQGDTVKAGFPALVIVPPSAEQVISSPVTGLVAQLHVQPNQALRPGTPLVRIVSRELSQMQLQLLQASTRATLARQTAHRERQLFGEGIIPQRRVQEADAALAESEATLSQAKTALRLSGMAAAHIEQVAASGKPQDSITLSATHAGIVTEVAVKPGQRVEPATALLHVAQTTELWLDIQVPVSQSAAWPAGTSVNVQGRNIAARIRSISPSVSATSQTVVLRAVITGKAGQVRPGELVTAELPVAAIRGDWDIPLAAVAHDGSQAHVFVRTATGFEARPVQITASAGQRVRVQGPLRAGEQIAISGVVALKGAWLDPKETK